jgi:hypothetical protein
MSNIIIKTVLGWETALEKYDYVCFHNDGDDSPYLFISPEGKEYYLQLGEFIEETLDVVPIDAFDEGSLLKYLKPGFYINYYCEDSFPHAGYFMEYDYNDMEDTHLFRICDEWGFSSYLSFSKKNIPKNIIVSVVLGEERSD